MGPSTWGSRRRRRQERSRKGRRILSGILFLVLGLAAAFIASALAGLWDTGAGTAAAPDPAPSAAEPSEIRVEVLNGSGDRGMARNATRQLRDDGFDVVFFGNASRFDHRRSFALDRTGDLEQARAVAAALGIDSVVTAVDSSLLLEVTVVLGDNWPPPGAEPLEGWIDRLPGRGPAERPAPDSGAPER
jgi:hypothetical protein